MLAAVTRKLLWCSMSTKHICIAMEYSMSDTPELSCLDYTDILCATTGHTACRMLAHVFSCNRSTLCRLMHVVYIAVLKCEVITRQHRQAQMRVSKKGFHC